MLKYRSECAKDSAISEIAANFPSGAQMSVAQLCHCLHLRFPKLKLFAFIYYQQEVVASLIAYSSLLIAPTPLSSTWYDFVKLNLPVVFVSGHIVTAGNGAVQTGRG